MLNHMNKHINRLSLDTVLGIEKVEHGLSKKPTKNELLLMEAAEHKLKRKPTLRELMKIETKEHLRSEEDEDDDDDDEYEGKMVVKRGSKC
jgi:hypothetical protein